MGLGAQDAVILTWQLSAIDGILTFLAEPGTAVDFRKAVHRRCWVTPSEFWCYQRYDVVVTHMGYGRRCLPIHPVAEEKRQR